VRLRESANDFIGGFCIGYSGVPVLLPRFTIVETAGSAKQLRIDAGRLMKLRQNDMEPAELWYAERQSDIRPPLHARSERGACAERPLMSTDSAAKQPAEVSISKRGTIPD
jgi:hypothetical protein